MIVDSAEIAKLRKCEGKPQSIQPPPITCSPSYSTTAWPGATPVAATVRPVTASEPARGGRWIVETEVPVWAAAPGQAVVLYDGELVLGGGRIARPVEADGGRGRRAPAHEKRGGSVVSTR